MEEKNSKKKCPVSKTTKAVRSSSAVTCAWWGNPGVGLGSPLAPLSFWESPAFVVFVLSWSCAAAQAVGLCALDPCEVTWEFSVPFEITEAEFPFHQLECCEFKFYQEKISEGCRVWRGPL